MKLVEENDEEKFVKKSGDTMTGYLYSTNGFTVSSSSTASKTQVYRGQIEIFNSTPFIDFHYGNSSSDYTARIIENSSGALTAHNTISNSSDRRLKNNIEDIDDKYLDLFDKLETKTYNFNNSDLKDCGFIAQDVLELEKEIGIDESILIRGTGEEFEIEKGEETKTEIDYYSLNYNNLVAMCVKKIQQLEKRIEELENKEK